ncbi:MAG: helicase-related protein, partial [Mycetocola sp.]
LTARLRSALARASVETLEPDLVILDEFQRFRHLLDPEKGGDAAELAHYLFNYEAAKVLLLSATPYKPYTASDSEDDEDHYSDFMTTLAFLSGSDSSLDDIRNGFSEYRRRVTLGQDVESVISRLRTSLLKLMSRTERPQLSAHDMLVERTMASAAPSRDDLQGFTALQRLGRELDVPIGIEYWKSIPYFANFMDSYQVSRALDRRLASDEVSGEGLGPLLGALQTIDPADVREYEPIDFGNSHLRALANETLDEGMWRLLWLPPSMPYLAPGSFYEPQEGRDLTKRVVFSSWTGTPTAVASLLSYEAERRMAQGSRLTTNSPAARKQISARLIYATDANGPQSMSSLLMFWPHPGLARVGDPLSIARRSPDLAPTAAKAEGEVYSALRNGGLGETPDFSWRSFFAMADALPGTLMADTSVLTEYLSARTGGSTEADPDDAEAGPAVSRGLGAHVAQALEAMNAGQTSGIHPDLAKLALHSPGNIAYRALGRIRAEADATTDPGCWQAAALLANGLRSLFNRVDSMLLIDSSADKSDADGEAYWRAVLRYCADGNLQAVLDEYVHQLRSESAGEPLNDSLLLDIARRAVEAITLRPSVYRAKDITSNGAESIPFTARFALRYGGKHHEQESARQPEIRNAFNSPFWPFVLTSTSVGQEGIDFHWWSHAVLHWNLPANPVDFEQREGRVHRFAGHAVRKNIARDHREHVMSSDARNPWASAFEAAAASHPDLGEFSPFWVYPGDSKVERQLATFPLSRDIEKLARLKASLTLYRLTLGQPRQQDMLELMERRGIVADALPKLDLSPPRRAEIDVVERGEPGLDRVEVPARSNV